MKKIVLSIVFAVSAYSINVNAQVGINVDSPSSTLDITAKNATGTSKNVDGLLVPRVDRERAQNMVSVPTSTIIFVNSIATGTQTGTAVNINSTGHYSFDGTVWEKLGTGTGSNVNIYNSDGSLTGNRVVTQGTNSLAFTSNVVNGFSVDGSTLSVDGLNNRVGVGTAAPHAQLHLGSSIANRKIVMYETADNDNEFYGFGVNPGIMRYQADRTTTDHVFYAGLTGGAGSNELLRIKGTGNVGIGTSTPNSKLDLGTIVGSSVTDVAGKKLAVYNDAAGTDFYGLGISGGLLQFHAASTAAEAPGMVLTGSGNVGVGTTSPTNTLDLAGTARIRTINNATGSTVIRPLYADATGVIVNTSLSSTYGGFVSGQITVGGGGVGQLITGVADGAYRVTVTTNDQCAHFTTADFFIHSFTQNGFFGLNAQGGFISGGGVDNHPTFNQTTTKAVVVTWPGVATTCDDGGNTTALNYTISMPSAGTVYVTNNGNINKTYRITLVRLN